MLNSVDEKSDFLCNQLYGAFEEFLTTRTFTSRPKLSWYNESLRDLKNVKIQAKRTYDSSKHETDWFLYTKARNDYKNSLKNAEKSYVQEKLYEYKNDSKNFWRTLKSLYSDPQASALNCVRFNKEGSCQKNRERFISL